jgi:hypothetical protein
MPYLPRQRGWLYVYEVKQDGLQPRAEGVEMLNGDLLRIATPTTTL